jgi:phytoene synthase
VTRIDDAYRRCAEITRAEAGNFFYGIRLLPSHQRAALCAVYALARRIDDIGDEEGAADLKLAALTGVEHDLRTLSERADDPVLLAVADAARRYDIPVDAFGDLVAGVRRDVLGHTYADFEDLVDYCRYVAGSIGRLCLAVFGSRPHPHAVSYADSLGVALQQTNILRDIREDLRNGRVYLPASDLEQFGVRLTIGADGRLDDQDGRLSRLVRHAAARADAWYVEGLRLLPLLDRRSGACCAAMAGIYRRLLHRIAENPQLVFDRRLSLRPAEKLTVAARALVGRAA